MAASVGPDQHPERPTWWGPPAGWTGGSVPANLDLARTDGARVFITDIRVFPTGIGLILRAETYGDPTFTPGDPTIDPKDQLRYGVEFQDGRSADRHVPVGGPGTFTIDGFQSGADVQPDPNSNIVFSWLGGARSPSRLSDKRFVWPLSNGQVIFYAEWPMYGIPRTEVVLSDCDIRRALRSARPPG